MPARGLPKPKSSLRLNRTADASFLPTPMRGDARPIPPNANAVLLSRHQNSAAGDSPESANRFIRRFERTFLGQVREIRGRRFAATLPKRSVGTGGRRPLYGVARGSRDYFHVPPPPPECPPIDLSRLDAPRPPPTPGEEEEVLPYICDPANKIMDPDVHNSADSYSFPSFNTASVDPDDPDNVIVTHHERRARHASEGSMETGSSYEYYSESEGIEGSEHRPIPSEELIEEEDVWQPPMRLFVKTVVRENASIAPVVRPRDGVLLAARVAEGQGETWGWAAPRPESGVMRGTVSGAMVDRWGPRQV